MTEMSKFSVDIHLAVQVDKLNKELEESKARGQQLSKLADDMSHVINNYRREVSKKEAENVELRRKVDKYEAEVIERKELSNICSSPASSEVTSSGISATRSGNEVANHGEAILSTQEFKVQAFLHNVQKMALQNETLCGLRDNGILPHSVKNRLAWFMRPTRHSMPLAASRKITWMTMILKQAKRYAGSDVERNDIDQFEKDVVSMTTSLFADDLAEELKAMVEEPPLKKPRMSCPELNQSSLSGNEDRHKIAFDFLAEMSIIVNRDETLTKLFERGTELPKNVSKAIHWLRHPLGVVTHDNRAENVVVAIVEKIYLISSYSKCHTDHLVACRDRLIALFRARMNTLEKD
ncbi:hypothetical protein HDE_12238 [Halotydeus destructor]|nr:hypothetical protein HDE_12238 [Halotydeus destructor]